MPKPTTKQSKIDKILSSFVSATYITDVDGFNRHLITPEMVRQAKAQLNLLLEAERAKTLNTLIAQVRGEGEPGNAGEMISVNEVESIANDLKENDNGSN